MSVSQGARVIRIDDKAKQVARQASNLNSQLQSMVNETLAFAAFMHTNPAGEIAQIDRDKYSDLFAQRLANINATISQLAPLAGIESGTVTVADFLAGYNGPEPDVYSQQFD